MPFLLHCMGPEVAPFGHGLMSDLKSVFGGRAECAGKTGKE